ncbi:MAG: rhodanese-like domain-containing protein [Candidatus Sericytochromatia bacterium]
MKKIKLVLTVLISTLTFFSNTNVSFAKDTKKETEAKDIKIENKDVDQIKAIFDKKDKNTVFIDVREPFEWQEGTMPNILKISLGSLPKEIEKLDKTKNYVLVCRSGNRSMKAAKLLKNAGFKNLTNFQGGMLSWTKKNYPLAK